MKVAIIQEWLVTVGGSDKVVKAIADVFPNADIFTLVAKKEVCDEKPTSYIFVIVILQFVMYGICITNIWKKQIWLKDSRAGL